MAEPHPSLMDEVRKDLRPVRPFLSPSRRSILVLAIAGLGALMFLATAGVRSDLAGLGAAFPVLLALRWILGMALVAAALREAVPSAGYPRVLANAILLTSAALLVALPMGQASRAENLPFSSSQMRCFVFELIIALPAFAFSYWLLARAYPLRPMIAAAAAGLGVGLIADAALFAHCAIDQPIHVALAHEGAVVTIALIGALLGLQIRSRG